MELSGVRIAKTIVHSNYFVVILGAAVERLVRGFGTDISIRYRSPD